MRRQVASISAAAAPLERPHGGTGQSAAIGWHRVKSIKPCGGKNS